MGRSGQEPLPYISLQDLYRYAAPHRVDEHCVREALELWEGRAWMPGARGGRSGADQEAA
eukprot:14638946-Alexandrium_andersonii.AAC.1